MIPTINYELLLVAYHPREAGELCTAGSLHRVKKLFFLVFL
jgi:hypothetical protein